MVKKSLLIIFSFTVNIGIAMNYDRIVLSVMESSQCFTVISKEFGVVKLASARYK